MGESRVFELTQGQHDRLMEVSKRVPAMLIGGALPVSAQDRANRFWKELGEEMGFDGMTVHPVAGKSDMFFAAEVVEREEGEMEDDELEEEFVEVDVRLMRRASAAQAIGGHVQVQRRTVRVNIHVARDMGRRASNSSAAVLEQIEHAIKLMIDEDERGRLGELLLSALETASPEKVKKALEVLRS